MRGFNYDKECTKTIFIFDSTSSEVVRVEVYYCILTFLLFLGIYFEKNVRSWEHYKYSSWGYTGDFHLLVTKKEIVFILKVPDRMNSKKSQKYFNTNSSAIKHKSDNVTSKKSLDEKAAEEVRV